MFNLSQFNMTQFNIMIPEEEDVRLTLPMLSDMQAMSGAGKNMPGAMSTSCFVLASACGGAGDLLNVSWSEDVAQSAISRVNHVLALSTRADVNNRSNIGLTFYPAHTWEMTIDNWAYFSGNIHDITAMDASVAHYAYLSSDFWWPAIGVDTIWWAQVSTKRFDMSYIDIDIDIPPGSTLIIDSDNCVVLLDGQDVIWSHSGSWLWLRRATFDVRVQAGNGALTADKTILYTERWV